uniref:Pre-mRNA-splicing factor 18 n=1 Tax=Ditylenchus dipsaci TaxID=166011 RepID=A0A915D1J1_9BILA
MEAGMHKQTMEQLRPLISSFEKYTCNSDIRIHLVHICRLCIIEKDYIRANTPTWKWQLEMRRGRSPTFRKLCGVYGQIAACRESGDQHELAKLREEFSEQFPLLPSIWLSWIEDEIEKGADQKTVESLFDRAIADFHSSRSAPKYIEWACGIDMAFAREVKLEQIVGIIGLRPDSADIVWESYLDIVEAEYCMLVNEDDCNTQKCIAKNQLKTLFDRALRVPTRDWPKFTSDT